MRLGNADKPTRVIKGSFEARGQSLVGSWATASAISEIAGASPNRADHSVSNSFTSVDVAVWSDRSYRLVAASKPSLPARRQSRPHDGALGKEIRAPT